MADAPDIAPDVVPGLVPNVVNVNDVPEEQSHHGAHWESFDKVLTPALLPRQGRLGMVQTRVRPGKSSAPFHTHHLEDEVFFILSGQGIFRYGDTVQKIKAGDCVSCPAGSGIAHQLANPFEQDLVYLSIGPNDPNEVCTYPDSGKVMVRALKTNGYLTKTEYWDGEPEIPRIFEMAKQMPV